MKMSQVPNLITLSRIAVTPVFVLLLDDGAYLAALVVFTLAGLSDGLDGLIAKRFHSASRLGAILDPAADKIMLVSAYVMLTIQGHIPFWLMIVVAFRDLLIVGGYVVYTSMYGPVRMRPSWLSKANTLLQITLAVAILFQLAAGADYGIAIQLLVYATLASTVASGAHYLWIWGVMKEIESDKGRSSQRGGRS
jgi:cardiolipin synthase (CMP-forming)